MIVPNKTQFLMTKRKDLIFGPKTRELFADAVKNAKDSSMETDLWAFQKTLALQQVLLQ